MSEPKAADSEDDRENTGRGLQLAQAVAEFLDLQSRGETVDLDAYCCLHAALEPELRTELLTAEQIRRTLESPESPATETEPEDEPPERLSGHRILGELGAGGMGRVFLALDEKLGREVAVKVLGRRYRTSELLRTRFMQEARAMARLSHPHIARIYRLGEDDTVPHFVMEYLEGTSLTEAARSLSLGQKVELMHKVVLAVGFLHEHQIIHRDLKPANILVGADLEPKVLDFGLALQVDASRKLTRPGEIMGTPDYFSPEQARANSPLDARSDIFSLGTIFYELLTSERPFRGETISEQIRSICEQEPELPRRLSPAVPGELQNICLKALEKNPADRYASAREMANDLQRFLAGEPVLAAPKTYSRLLAGKIEQHLRELQGWAHDRILSESEFDAFRRLYEKVVDREDAWIMEARRLTLTQVSLYLGAWVLVAGAVLVVIFDYAHLAGTPAVLTVAAATAPTAYLGIRCWNERQRRIGIAYLLAFCLLLPTALLIAMREYRLLTALTQNDETLELFARVTNAQLWWAFFVALPAYYGLRRFTKASVFSLVLAVMTALLCLVTLLRMGLLDWIKSDPGKFYLYLLPFAVQFFVVGLLVERERNSADARYFYFVGLVFTFVGLSGLAAVHKPYREWLESVAPQTRGQVEYLFMINALLYLVLQDLFDRIPWMQVRLVAKAFRFVVPGHVLTSLLLLGLAASERWDGSPEDSTMRLEARFFEVVLPLTAGLFILGSISKQMKNFFATGMLFLVIGIVRLQQDMFKERAVWPISLLLAGLALMLAAAHYPPLRMALARWTRRGGK